MQGRTIESRESLINCVEVIKCLAERPRRHPPDGVNNLEGWSASSDRGIKKLSSPGNERGSSIPFNREN